LTNRDSRQANSKELDHSTKTTYRDIFFAVQVCVVCVGPTRLLGVDRLNLQGQKVSIMKRGRLVEHLGAVQVQLGTSIPRFVSPSCLVQEKFSPNHAQV
jgi:hypothetical protein